MTELERKKLENLLETMEKEIHFMVLEILAQMEKNEKLD